MTQFVTCVEVRNLGPWVNVMLESNALLPELCAVALLVPCFVVGRSEVSCVWDGGGVLGHISRSWESD